jgi:hypothetical protein
MTTTTRDSERDELVRLVLEGAAANGRPDLAHRLRAAGPAEVPETIVRALESLEVDLRSRRAALVEPGRGARLDAESRPAERRRREFEEHAAKWPRLLGDALSAVDSDFEYALQMRLRSLVEEGTTRIESGGRPGAESGVWLRERLAAEAGELQEMMRSATTAVAERVATTLGLTVPSPAVPIVLGPPADPGRRPARSDRQPLASRLLGVVMPTYSGMMIALVLPRFFDLVLPIWLIVTVAALGALTLGGAALAGERQRQAGRRNAEAIGELRSAADAFRMTLSKQGRDVVRAVEQELHATVGEAVRQRTRRLSAEAAAMRDRAAECRNPEQALKDIETDLESVRELRSRARKLVQ